MLIRNEVEMVAAFTVLVCITAAGCIGLSMTDFFAVSAIATGVAVAVVAAVLALQKRTGGSGDTNFFDRHPMQAAHIVVLTDPARLADTLETLRAGGWTPATVTI